jgi:peptidyl-dipeptidase Dcp
VHEGANLSDGNKAKLKAFNSEISTLSDNFTTKLLDATKNGAYATTNATLLAGLSDAQLSAAAQAAQARAAAGYLLPLQNTTQQPDLATLKDRSTRESIFRNSWNRAERNDGNDTRETISRLARMDA